MGTLPFSFAQDTHLTMNAFILLTACVAASQAQYIAHPRFHAVAGAYAGVPAGVPVAAGAYAPYAAPVPVAAPVAPSSQFHAGDEFGNIQYGYANINSQKHEVGNTYGGVSGSYSYVDANGIVQTTNYIADGAGFRVQATNLPVAPVADLAQPEHVYTLPVAPVFEGVGPAPAEDTPEVAAAKVAFQAAFDEAANREKRSVPADTAVLPAAAPLATAPLIAAGLPHVGYAGLPHVGYAGLPHVAGLPYAGLPYAGLPYAAPVAAPAAVVASAPATADAELHTVKLNPGHA